MAGQSAQDGCEHTLLHALSQVHVEMKLQEGTTINQKLVIDSWKIEGISHEPDKQPQSVDTTEMNTCLLKEASTSSK